VHLSYSPSVQGWSTYGFKLKLIMFMLQWKLIKKSITEESHGSGNCGL
jgi:hypothetical protein